MKKTTNFLIGFIAQFLITLVFRLVPVGMPIAPMYFSPITAFQLSFSKVNVLWGFLFGFLNIMIVNLIRTYMLGLEEFSLGYTLLYASIFGIIPCALSPLLRIRKLNATIAGRYISYFIAGFIGIVLYDAITGVLIPCVQGYSFGELFAGQVAWTTQHSLWNLPFVILGPLIETGIAKNKKLQLDALFARFKAA